MSNKNLFIFNKLYDTAKVYSDLPWHDPEPPEMLARTLDGRSHPGRALDIGCGAGTYSLYMARRGYSVTAVDFMPKAVEMTRQRAKEAGADVEAVQADILSWQPDGAFDVILDVGCLHSLAQADRLRYRDQILRWLAPGGDFVLIHCGSRGWWDRWPIGPGRVAREKVESLFAPELQPADYSAELLTGMPLLVGRSALAARYRFHRAAAS